MTNAVLQAIADRRSNRGYAPRQLTEEELGAILTAAVQAPSARNTQPWHFSVVQNAALLKEFSDDYNALQKADPGRDILFFEAPTVVFISTPIEAPTKFSQIDCGIAAQNMALDGALHWPGQRHPRPAHGRVQERKGARATKRPSASRRATRSPSPWPWASRRLPRRRMWCGRASLPACEEPDLEPLARLQKVFRGAA